jgi:hypothetical protein
MFYQEKRTLISTITGLLLLVLYGTYVLIKYQHGKLNLDSDIRVWAVTMLTFIALGVGIMIIVQIAFHITNAIIHQIKKEEQDDPIEEDEMDKLIALKAYRNAYIMIGVGFVASLISLAIKQPPVIMLNILFLSFCIGSIFEGITQLYFYKKGFYHG